METDFYKALGARLATARKSAGLKQTELAETLGIAQQTLAHYETGRSRVSVMLLLEMAKALRFSVDEMLTAEESKVALGQRLRRQLEALAGLPRARQKFVLDLIDTVLAKR